MKISNYILVSKVSSEELSNLKKFFNSLFVHFSISELDKAYCIDYTDDIDKDVLYEALNSYLLDATSKIICYIGQSEISQKDVDIKIILKYFNNSLKNQIYDVKSIAFEMIDNKDDDLARLVLKKYINDYDTLELLKVFFMNNMNVLKSAKLLYIHRNTLINKLARFKEDTSFDPKEFRDAYIVYSLIK